MAHKYEVEMIRAESSEPLATAVFANIDDAKTYIKGHGKTDIKFSLYELVNGERILL